MAGQNDQPEQDLLQQAQADQWQTWAEGERARRQRALSALARQAAVEASPAVAAQTPEGGAPPVPAISLAPPRRQANPSWLLLLSAALVVTVVGAAMVHALALTVPRQTARPILTVQPSLTVVPSADGLDCLQDAAWSPDGSRIAVLGYQQGSGPQQCPVNDPFNYAYLPGTLYIYSASTGTLLSRLNPDRTIIPALHLKPPSLPKLPSTFPDNRGDTSHQVITYIQVLWSADGSRLALPFSIDRFYNVQINSNGSGSSQTVSTDGVLVAPVIGSGSTVLLGPAPNPAANTSTTPGEWDLAKARYIPESSPIDLTQRTALPQALGYSWNPGGSLSPVRPLTSGVVPQTPPLGPVGNPAGEPSFTIWQPGRIGPDAHLGPGVYQYQTQFSAWSPDGRYLYPSLNGYFFGELVVPVKYGPSPQDLAAELPPVQPLLPVRDKALGAIMSHGYFGDVAWSLNGRLLLFVRELGTAMTSTGIDAGHVHLYDCATGAEVAMLTHDVAAGFNSDGTLHWSADNAHVFMVSRYNNAIPVWTLPKAVRR